MKKTLLSLCVLFGLLGLQSCEKAPEQPKAKPVVVFGTDGFSAEIVKKHPDEFPNLKKLMAEGSYSYEMRSVLPSASACNWMSILTGTPIEIHGHTTWSSAKPEITPRIQNEEGKFPGIFRLIREQKPEAITGFFYNWKTMGELFDKGTETKSLQAKDGELIKDVKDFISQENPDLTFIVFGEPDGAGHASGWESPEYIAACKVIDSYLGEVAEAVKNSPRGKETLFLFVADHGGINKPNGGGAHGGKTLKEMCPMYVMTGEGIKKNHEIQDDLMVYDIASTIAHYMALKQPQAWRGKSITPEEESQ